MSTVLLTFLLSSGSAWAQDADMATREAAALVALGERASPEGQLRAREHVLRRLEALGFTPRCLGLEPGLDACFACVGEPAAGAFWSLSHLDAVQEAPGAIDNAAAVGVNLAAAAALRGETTPQPVCFAFPEGEERGLLGAEQLQDALAAEGRTPGLVLSMDLVGHGELTANGLGPRWGDDSLRWLLVTLGDPPVSVPFVYRALSRGVPSMERSDHRPFTEAGVRSLHLMGRGPDGLYWRYHTGLDAMDQVEPAAMARTLDAVLRLARAPVPGEDGGEPAFAARGAVVPGAVTLGAMGLGALMGLSAVFGRLKATALGAAMGVVRALGLGLVWTLVLAVGSLGASTLGERAEPCAAAALAFVILGLTSRRGSRLDGGGATAGALVCLALMVALFRVEPLLALPYGVAAFGLGLSARGGHPGLTALLTLPGPLYLTSGDVWRELRFHGLAPDALAPWGLFVTVVWLPVACWSHDWRGAIRGERVALVAVGVAALVWAWLTPAFSAALPELTGR